MEPTEPEHEEETPPEADKWPPGTLFRPDPFDLDYSDEEVGELPDEGDDDDSSE